MFTFRSTHGPVELAFTDRSGGSGPAALDAFAPDAVPAPRMVQVHGAAVTTVPYDDGATDPVECDGQVTDRPDLVLAVRVADCVPVLLADGAAGVIGVAHAGRRGVAAGVVPRTVERMRECGATALTAWIGPHICGACYEVPPAMQAEVAGLEPTTRATTAWGTPALDLGAGVRAQLHRADVAVVDAARCTRESDDLDSFRRDGERAGRMAGLVRLRGAA